MTTLGTQILEAASQMVSADLSDGTSGNLSARCDDGGAVLITPTGRRYARLDEHDLVHVDLATGAARGRWDPSSEWRLHTAIYLGRPEVNAVIHHHGIWASAVAVARATIPVLIDEAADLGAVATAPYAPSGSPELAATVSRQFADGSNAVLLANHGAVVAGRSLDEALRRALQVERLAKIFIAARLLGGARELTEDEVGRLQPFFQGYRAHQVDAIPRAPVTAPLPRGAR